jgi:hypothetical protein
MQSSRSSRVIAVAHSGSPGVARQGFECRFTDRLQDGLQLYRVSPILISSYPIVLQPEQPRPGATPA